MLAFFRKYEKTFFLIVFLPAIIGMGVTSVIVTALTDKDRGGFNGKVFDEPINPTDWETVVRPRAKMFGRSEEGSEQQFEFYALCKAAERAGVRVPEAKLSKDIKEQTAKGIAALLASQKVKEKGIDTRTE